MQSKPKARTPAWKRVLQENEEEAWGLLLGVVFVSLVLTVLSDE
jgi:hypothetical protein